MHLTIYYDGQFWVGVIEVVDEGNLKAFRYVFGTEPKDAEVLTFIHEKLLNMTSESASLGIEIKDKCTKRINPKRLQRKVAKEMHSIGISTKAQEALKQAYDEKKISRKKFTKQQREKLKEQKYLLKKQKVKQKHRGK